MSRLVHLPVLLLLFTCADSCGLKYDAVMLV
jgi:hypothetical protein